jgi:hypothetical protein
MKRLLLGAMLVIGGAAVDAQTPEGERELLTEPLEALSHDTVGPSPQVVSPSGSYALSIDGDFELGGFVFKDGHPFLHNDGGPTAGNSGFGRYALVSLTPGVPHNYAGKGNTALGDSALRNNTEGQRNTATGYFALSGSTSGNQNTATGAFALGGGSSYGSHNTANGAGALTANKSGSFNTASGAYALALSLTGNSNTASGNSALFNNSSGQENVANGARALGSNTTGSNNIALGFRAGYNLGYDVTTPLTSMSGNIFIGNEGETDEEQVIRIGSGQNKTFIAGVDDQTLTVSAVEVCVESTGQLGRCNLPSSRRTKQDIRDIGARSERLLALRPVTFRFKEEVAGQETTLQFGLIAEEVAEVYPELVAYDEEGRPEAVKYRFLSSLLLNELQEQAMEIQRMKARLERLEAAEPGYRRTGLRGPP